MAQGSSVSPKVLEIVKRKGPVVPTEVSKEIGAPSYIASAILSELVSGRQLRISSLKVGGTPLYYAPGQEGMLQGFTKYLHEKERKAFDMLKEALVLRDRALDPVMRVAMREIRDFAIPLNVQNGQETELFWRWYLIKNDEAEPLIKKLLGLGEEKKAASEEAPAAKEESEITEAAIEPKPNEKPRAKKRAVKDNTEFIKRVLDYFARNKVDVVEKFEAKKKGEAEFIISVPSSVGTIRYYCKAKDKATCNDGDLSTAYVKGQAKKLPTLFLATGKLTKNAAEMLETEFSNMNVKAI